MKYFKFYLNVFNNKKILFLVISLILLLSKFSIPQTIIKEEVSVLPDGKTRILTRWVKQDCGNKINPSNKPLSANDATVRGKVISGTTTLGLPNIKVVMYEYGNWPEIIDTFTTYTNNQGDFEFLVTDVEANNNVSNVGIVKYYANTIELPQDCKMTIFDILGQKVISNNLTKGISHLDFNQLANGVYILLLESKDFSFPNKFIKQNKNYFYSYTQKEVTIPKNSTNKYLPYSNYTFKLYDSSGTYYNWVTEDWQCYPPNIQNLFIMPMLEKKILDDPFYDSEYGQNITEIRDFIYYSMDSYFYAFLYSQAPIPYHIYLGIPDLPLNYSESEIREGTNEMLSQLLLPLDSVFIDLGSVMFPDPCYDQIRTVNYFYVDSIETQGYDFITEFCVCWGQEDFIIDDIQFYFNKQSIEPGYIKQFIKLGLWRSFFCRRNTPVEGYISYNPRTASQNLKPDEVLAYRFISLYLLYSPKNIAVGNFQ